MKKVIDLLDEDRFFKSLFDAMPVGIMLVNSDQKVQRINTFMQQEFGFVDKTIINKSIGEAIHCMNTESGVCGRKDYCQNCQILGPAIFALQGKQIQRNKAEIKLQVGDKIQDKVMLVTAAPIEYEQGRGAVLILEDITELSSLRRHLKKPRSLDRIIGNDPKIIEIRDRIKTLAEVDVPVMIQGESGTGKELIANAIHEEGPRANKPFIAINCGALPEHLLESELFGHVKGAFTGAIRDKKGRFELADGGTLFLDEIGDISPAMQIKLLRVLQEGFFEPVGSEKTITVDVRVISATNKDIHKEITAGRFRSDLFYRLCVVPLFIQPLRKRRGDIPLLTEHILNDFLTESKYDRVKISADALEILKKYNWPGNVRELQNAIRYALVHADSNMIEPAHILPVISNVQVEKIKGTRQPRKRKIDENAVRQALKQAQDNKVEAAKILGISRSTLYRFLDFSSLA